MIDYLSPNFNDRSAETTVDLLILHYTGMKSAQEALDRMCDPAVEVSAHYCIDLDGTVYRLVAEDKRAWHAGVSFWQGARNINDRSIGVELVNKGHEWGYHPFPEAQIRALIDLCQGILTRHQAITPARVIGHSDVAPARKQDPGELFPWQRLAQDHGIGIWPFPETKDAAGLARFGYDVSEYDAALLAWQRHFDPDAILD